MTKKPDENFVKETRIRGLYLIQRPVFPDERGSFREIARISDFKKYGIEFAPIQFNHSISKPNVIRAIHTEKMQKLVYPLTGKTFAALIDFRVDSETFGVVEEIVLDAQNEPCASLFIPPGVGNSICVMGDTPVHYIYAVDRYWEPGIATGIAWDDPELSINWPVKNPVISKRDKNNPTVIELFGGKFKKK